MDLFYLCLDEVSVCWNVGRLFWNLGMHFKESGDFRSPWKDEVDGDRKGFTPAWGHPQPLQSPQKNLLMREWLSPALHFPLCVSEKYKWRSPHRQVCLPRKVASYKNMLNDSVEAFDFVPALARRWNHKCTLVLRGSYHGLVHRMEASPEKKHVSWLYHMCPWVAWGERLMVGAASGHWFDFNCETNTALRYFFFFSFHLNLAWEYSHPKQKQTYWTLYNICGYLGWPQETCGRPRCMTFYSIVSDHVTCLGIIFPPVGKNIITLKVFGRKSWWIDKIVYIWACCHTSWRILRCNLYIFWCHLFK